MDALRVLLLPRKDQAASCPRLRVCVVVRIRVWGILLEK